ncbi:Guanine deaminase [Alcanivorax sp. ALC70]|nr:Guanine deaminase [Alcanivorax sp. ALC70]
MGDTLLIRAGLLNPVDANRWTFHREGGLLLEGERIVDAGPLARFRDHPASRVLDLDGVLVPGFVDVHIHWVQHHVRGRFQSDLMEWLREHIWPEEAGFEADDFARRHARAFFTDTVRAGTTLGMAYSSPHLSALRLAGEAARGDWLLGNAIMEKAAPEPLRRASPDNVDQVAPLLAELGTGRYAITPRFALNCSAGLMRDLGDLARRENAFVQTHLSESVNEIREIRAAFPEAEDYTDVYDRAGLLGRARCWATASICRSANTTPWPGAAPGSPTARPATRPWAAGAWIWRRCAATAPAMRWLRTWAPGPATACCT